jgi:transcriptional regulator with XRE-family HTH domain
MLEIDMLEAQRKRLNMTQEDVARLIGVTFSTFNRWLKDHHVPRSHPVIDKIKEVTRELSKRKGVYGQR